MRYVTVRLTPDEDVTLHPLGAELRAEPDVVREAIHRAELLADGTAVILGEVRGDRERFEGILDESPYVIDFTVSGSEGSWYAYTHFEPTGVARQMLRQRRESAVMIEMPVKVRADGSLVMTFVGEAGSFDHAMLAETDAYDLEVLETGERAPDTDSLYRTLTARQQEILDVAVDLGYYENPREATQADVAEAVGTTPSTAGEHLRKIESRVFGEFVRT